LLTSSTFGAAGSAPSNEWSQFIEAAIENVDQDQDGFISREEFRELCVLLPRGFAHAQHEASAAEERRSVRQATCTQRCCPGFAKSREFGKLRRLMHSKHFESVMHGLISINAVVILAELRFEYEPGTI
jgi:hypothetical protein